MAREYAQRGVAVENPPRVRVLELCRFLADVARDSVLATAKERRVSVLPDMTQILQLEESHHPNVVDMMIVRADRRLSNNSPKSSLLGTYEDYTYCCITQHCECGPGFVNPYTMETDLTQERQQAHVLLDMLPVEKLTAVRSLLEVMVEPLSRSLASAPVEEEELTSEAAAALDRARASLARGEGTPHEDILREFGLGK